MKNYLNALCNFANIKGRMARHVFWQFMLLNFVFYLLIGFITPLSLNFISSLYQIMLLSPTLCAMVRRLHDTGKSGKWVVLLFGMTAFSLLMTIATASNANVDYNKYVNVTLLFLLMSLSSIGALVYVLSVAGETGANKYGPDPREVKREEGGG